MYNLDDTIVKEDIADDLPTDIMVDYSSIDHIECKDIDIIRDSKEQSKEAPKKCEPKDYATYNNSTKSAL